MFPINFVHDYFFCLLQMVEQFSFNFKCLFSHFGIIDIEDKSFLNVFPKTAQILCKRLEYLLL